MWKVLILFVLSLFLVSIAREVSSVGKVKAYYRKGDIWKGTPTLVYIEVINDVDYAYYVIPDTTSPLLRYVGKDILFSGRVWVDSTYLKDGGLKHLFILIKNFDIKKEK